MKNILKYITVQDETITVELKSGIAEIFGTEMVLGTKYAFRSGAKFAVFTYHGCQILVSDEDSYLFLQTTNLYEHILFVQFQNYVQSVFLKMGQSRHLFNSFSSFQTHIRIFRTNKSEKVSIQYTVRDSNSRPLEHESPPITTRPEPGLRPIVQSV